MSLLVVLCPIDEYHMYSRVNSFIYSMYSEYEEIWAIAPHSACCILSAASKVITSSELTGDLYPKILERLDDRLVYGLISSGFLDRVLCYLDDVKVKKFVFFHNMPDDELTKIGNIKQFNRFEFIKSGGIPDDFLSIGNFINNSTAKILPFKEDYFNIKLKFKLLTSNNKFTAILTRNFNDKQPFYNTGLIDLFRFSRKCIKNGYSVVNIGFPYLSLKSHFMYKYFGDTFKDNYLEVTDLNYSEMLCVVSFCEAWRVVPHAGGFSIHVCTPFNLIIDGKEFCRASNGMYLKDFRRLRSDIGTFDTFEHFLKEGTPLKITPDSLPSYNEKVVDL
jgi:hypothetical protein